MAMTDAQICNLALGRIGHKQFLEDLDDDSQAADCCRAAFLPAVLELLEASDWGFARKHATLAQLSSVTRSGWSLAYALPTDCLVVRSIFSGLRTGASYAHSARADLLAMGGPLPTQWGAVPQQSFSMETADDGNTRLLLTDMTQAEILYTTSRVTSGVFSQAFTQALAWKLASEFALSLSVKRDLHANADAQYRAALLRAKALNLREAQDDGQPESQFITSRG